MIKSVTDAVRQVVDNYPSGHKFYGYELHNDVSSVYSKARNKYPDTLLRMMRRYCSNQYSLVDRDHSLYEKI